MPSYDELLHRENVRVCISLNLFNKLKREDLEDEITKLNKKLQISNEWTDLLITRINLIKEFLKK